MGTWNSLPTEIRTHVLYLFCLNVVEEYNDFDIDLNEIYNALAELEWPKPPECLSSLASSEGNFALTKSKLQSFDVKALDLSKRTFP
jgi:hypothetical protein